tara:strand:- start:19297 stop:19533 length:237 start_codon:yes stop_codon:yes gene_type:complete
MSSKWIKVDSEFLSDALISAMVDGDMEITNERPTTWKGGKVHSFKQIDKHNMIVCWECSDGFGGVEMGNCVIKNDWYM